MDAENLNLLKEYRKIYFPSKISYFKFGIKLIGLRIYRASKDIWQSIKSIFSQHLIIPDSRIQDVVILDPKKEKMLSKKEVLDIYMDLLDQSDGKYDKNIFKLDLFARNIRHNDPLAEFQREMSRS